MTYILIGMGIVAGLSGNRVVLYCVGIVAALLTLAGIVGLRFPA